MLLSVVRINRGRIMQASVSPPDRIENPSPNTTQKNALPNKPNTTDGTAASVSRLTRTKRLTGWTGDTTSTRNKAAPTASGNAVARHTSRMSTVETTIEPIPPARPAFRGASTMNDQEI